MGRRCRTGRIIKRYRSFEEVEEKKRFLLKNSWMTCFWLYETPKDECLLWSECVMFVKIKKDDEKYKYRW